MSDAKKEGVLKAFGEQFPYTIEARATEKGEMRFTISVQYPGSSEPIIVDSTRSSLASTIKRLHEKNSEERRTIEAAIYARQHEMFPGRRR